MDIRRLTERYAVSPQIDPADLPKIAEEGFVAVICNRPDMEVDGGQSSTAIREAAEAAGVAFVFNPIVNGAMGPAQVEEQAQALAKTNGPVLAYCRSGTRSCFVWAFGVAGAIPVADIVETASKAGYDLGPAEAQLDAIAKARLG